MTTGTGEAGARSRCRRQSAQPTARGPALGLSGRLARWLVLGLAVCCGASALAADNLRLTFSDAPPNPQRIGTARRGLTLEVAEGAEVGLARSRGTESRAAWAGAFGWVSVASVPRDAESLVLTAQREDGAVRVALAVARKRGDELLRYRSEVLAAPGEWLPLWQPAPAPGARVYRAGGRSDGLWLRVELPR